jgi:hypothetical protein
MRWNAPKTRPPISRTWVAKRYRLARSRLAGSSNQPPIRIDSRLTFQPLVRAGVRLVRLSQRRAGPVIFTPPAGRGSTENGPGSRLSRRRRFAGSHDSSGRAWPSLGRRHASLAGPVARLQPRASRSVVLVVCAPSLRSISRSALAPVASARLDHRVVRTPDRVKFPARIRAGQERSADGMRNARRWNLCGCYQRAALAAATPAEAGQSRVKLTNDEVSLRFK